MMPKEELPYAPHARRYDSPAQENGFVRIKSNNGSHQKLFNAKTQTTVIVPLHAKELKKGLEQAILKQAGLK